MLVRLRPKDAVCRIRRQLAVGHVSDIRALDRKIKAVRSQIAELVEASGTTLVDLFGIGPVIAGRILAEVGDINRFATKDRFATYNGTAPIDVSSGDQVRHRLSRSGNRHINHALHMMAVTQIRNPKSEGRAYYERKRLEGKTGKEALRCLKRRLSDVVYRQLLADEQGRIARCGSPTTERPTPPTSTSPTSRYRAVTPRREPKPHLVSRHGSRSTGGLNDSSGSRFSTPTPSFRRISSRRLRTSTERSASTPRLTERSRSGRPRRPTLSRTHHSRNRAATLIKGGS